MKGIKLLPLLLLAGCISVQQKEAFVDHSDKPWLGKPPEIVKRSSLVQSKSYPFLCDAESYDGPVDAKGAFESSLDLKQWQEVSVFPYDGQTHGWTSNVPCFVRTKRILKTI